MALLLVGLVTPTYLPTGPLLAPQRSGGRSLSPLLIAEPASVTELLPLDERGVDKSFALPDDERTWPDFTYSSPAARREAVRQFRSTLPSPLPPVHVLLVGGPSTGKGTIGPMISQAFGVRAVGIGDLLRSKQRAGTPEGKRAAEVMAKGELLPDDYVLDLLGERLRGSWDVRRNGWLLDGFPRTEAQARAILSEDLGEEGPGSELKPDCVVVLQRPAALMKEFMLGRMHDAATGQVYHPRYHPPPKDVTPRLVWRVDDTASVVQARISEFEKRRDAVLRVFDEVGSVPLARFDNARPEVETFEEIGDFIRHVALLKLERMGGEGALALLRSEGDDEDEDVTTIGADECGPDDGLLRAVRRCNRYRPTDYFPVLVEDLEVGWVSADLLRSLEPHLAAGSACELVPLESDRDETEGGPAAGSAARKATVGVRLAPRAISCAGRTEIVDALVADLVADGVIARRDVRHEHVDVRPLRDGWVGPGGAPPTLQLERGAVVHFGVPS